MALTTAGNGPQLRQLPEDPLAEVVAGVGERESGVRVQALERPCAARSADAARERRAAVGPGLARGERQADAGALRIGVLAARPQRVVTSDRVAPALDAAGSLEPRDRG